MDLLVIVSTPQAAAILSPMAQAFDRAKFDWAVFFTNDGVKVLTQPAIISALSSARHKIACHDSWERFGKSVDCPVELGSQTNNSELVGQAARIVSL